MKSLLLFVALLFPFSSAWATGSEMAGFALIIPMIALCVLGGLAVLALVIHKLLPKAWPKGRRLAVTAVLAPLVFGLLMVVVAVTNYLTFASAGLMQ